MYMQVVVDLPRTLGEEAKEVVSILRGSFINHTFLVAMQSRENEDHRGQTTYGERFTFIKVRALRADK